MTDEKAILGNDCIVSVKIGDFFYPIGCGISCSFEVDQEIINITSVNSGLFNEKRVRRTDWRGTISSVMVSDNTIDRYSVFYFLQDAVRRSVREYEFSYTDLDGNEKTIVGEAIIKAIPITAAHGSFAKYDLQIEGTGGFEIDPLPPIATNCEDIFSDTWSTTPGENTITGNSINGNSFEGYEVIAVYREGLVHSIIDSGFPGNQEALYDGTTITFDVNNPFNPDETVFVIWVVDVS